MAKKSSHHSVFDRVSLLIIVSLILLAAVGYLGLKDLSTRIKLQKFSAQIQQDAQQYAAQKNHEEAMMIATTVSMVPAGLPLYRQPQELQHYVTTISQQTARDLVITDASEIILADTIPANIGTQYIMSPHNEVQETLSDGNPRVFEEKGKDYPQGIWQTVVPIKDSKGSIVGSVIFSR